VPVPVDSILNWGCDDDLLNARFNSCDVADSTTGGLEHNNNNLEHHCLGLGASGSGSLSMKMDRQQQLMTLDNIDTLLSNAAATVLAATTPTTPIGPGPGGGQSFVDLKPLAFEYGNLGNLDNLSLSSVVGCSGGADGGQQQQQQQQGTRSVNLDINLNVFKTNAGLSGAYYGGEQVSTTTVGVSVNNSSGGGSGNSSTSSVMRGDPSMVDFMMNPEIDDIAQIISNAIADSTVAPAAQHNHHHHHQHHQQQQHLQQHHHSTNSNNHHQHSSNNNNHHHHSSGGADDSAGVSVQDIRDQWADIDIDAWFQSACSPVYGSKQGMLEQLHESSPLSDTSATSNSSLSSASPAFPASLAMQSSCSVVRGSSGGSTLQELLTQGGAAAGSVALSHLATSNSINSMHIKNEPCSIDTPLLHRRLMSGRDSNGASTTSNNNNNGSMSNNNTSLNNHTSYVSSCSIAGAKEVPHTTFHTSATMNQVSTSFSGGGGGADDCSSSFPTARRTTIPAPKNQAQQHYVIKDDLDDSISGTGSGAAGSAGAAAAAAAKSRHKNRSSKSKISTVMTSEGGKEKPVHRCNICNRGFLNKSNIKVHLRTHTGEKPFKCDACAKAFRQKAHLLKHMQIHKRVSRD